MLFCTVCNTFCRTAYHLATHLESHGVKTKRFLETFPDRSAFSKFFPGFKAKYSVQLIHKTNKRNADGRLTSFYHCKHPPVNSSRCCPFFVTVVTEVDGKIAVQGIVSNFGHVVVQKAMSIDDSDSDSASGSPPLDTGTETDSAFDNLVCQAIQKLTAIQNYDCTSSDKQKLTPHIQALIEVANTLIVNSEPTVPQF